MTVTLRHQTVVAVVFEVTDVIRLCWPVAQSCLLPYDVTAPLTDGVNGLE